MSLTLAPNFLLDIVVVAVVVVLYVGEDLQWDIRFTVSMPFQTLLDR